MQFTDPVKVNAEYREERTAFAEDDMGADKSFSYTPRVVKEEQTTRHTRTMAASAGPQLHTAAQDLVGQLIRSFGKPAEPVFIKAENARQTLDPSFAGALAQALTLNGIEVASEEGQSPFSIIYGATPLGGDDAVAISLSFYSGSDRLTQVSGVYNVGNQMVYGAAAPSATASAPAKAALPPPAPAAYDESYRSLSPGAVSEPVPLVSE